MGGGEKGFVGGGEVGCGIWGRGVWGGDGEVVPPHRPQPAQLRAPKGFQGRLHNPIVLVEMRGTDGRTDGRTGREGGREGGRGGGGRRGGGINAFEIYPLPPLLLYPTPIFPPQPAPHHTIPQFQAPPTPQIPTPGPPTRSAPAPDGQSTAPSLLRRDSACARLWRSEAAWWRESRNLGSTPLSSARGTAARRCRESLV